MLGKVKGLFGGYEDIGERRGGGSMQSRSVGPAVVGPSIRDPSGIGGAVPHMNYSVREHGASWMSRVPHQQAPPTQPSMDFAKSKARRQSFSETSEEEEDEDETEEEATEETDDTETTDETETDDDESDAEERVKSNQKSKGGARKSKETKQSNTFESADLDDLLGIAPSCARPTQLDTKPTEEDLNERVASLDDFFCGMNL